MLSPLDAILGAGAAAAVCCGFAYWRRAQLLATRIADNARIGGAALAECEARRSALEQELSGLRADHEALLRHCGAGVIFLDTGGIVRDANRKASHLLRLSGGLVRGRSLLEATLSDEVNGMLREAREEMRTHQREVIVSGSGGVSLLVSISPMRSGSDGQTSFILIAHDVTELRRLETIRRDFVANVSHELRTPLASIRAMAETLQDGALEDLSVSDHFLSIVVTEAKRLTRISDDLLILSQAESGTPDMQPMQLADLVMEVVHRFGQQASQAGIALDADLSPDLNVIANHDQIEQVVINLVDNAIKYTPAGGHVRVTAEARETGIAVHVSDTGIGIMAKDLPRIFERFYRVDKARSRQSGGTGLGLSIVKHIVEAHGGQVNVKSEYNRGSTFTFILPTHSATPSLVRA